MGYSVVCAVFGHRYTYQSVLAGGRVGPSWVCRRCGDRQDTRPPPNEIQMPFLGGPPG